MTTPPRTFAHDPDRGSESVATALVLPLLLGIVLALVQGALWYHGKTLAHAAASSGYHQARTLNGTVASGTTAAQQLLAGPTTLTEATVTVSRGDTEVTVVVSGTTPTIVPFLAGPRVEQHVSGPTERWVAP